MTTFLTSTNQLETTNFHYIDWPALVDIAATPKQLGDVKPEEAKDSSSVIAATDAPNKRKETILTHDNFTLLRLDLDDTHFTIEDLITHLQTISIQSYIIHTTASHQQDAKGNRYRIYIELADSLNYAVWAMLETYLSYLFIADDCATRPQQIMYLPVRFDSDQYEFYVGKGKAFKADKSTLLSNAQSFKDAQLQEQETASVNTFIKGSYPEKLIGKQVSIIDAVNQSYDWDSLLTSYGYKRQGKAYLPPESTSKKAGAYILTSHTDGKERYYSHHENDPCATGQCIDKFDFITIRDFAGDHFNALKTLAKSHFPELDKHNKEEWKVHQDNIRIKAVFKEVI